MSKWDSIAGSDPDPWRVLGVKRGASEAEIRAAYRDKARQRHPDAGGRESSMARLNAARDAALGRGARNPGTDIVPTSKWDKPIAAPKHGGAVSKWDQPPAPSKWDKPTTDGSDSKWGSRWGRVKAAGRKSADAWTGDRLPDGTPDSRWEDRSRHLGDHLISKFTDRDW